MTNAEVRTLFGNNYIGLDELKPFFDKLGLDISSEIQSEIQFSDTDLIHAASRGYILIYGLGHIEGQKINLKFLRNAFGFDPEQSEPCFYNQDWYINEDFMDISLNSQWYLIKKEVFEDSRAVMPVNLKDRGVFFPTAILASYTFFAYYFSNNEYLWYHDFIWCQDVDHNGDLIYVGKYNDVDGINKNGFSIHRHLSLRPCYGMVDSIM